MTKKGNGKSKNCQFKRKSSLFTLWSNPCINTCNSNGLFGCDEDSCGSHTCSTPTPKEAIYCPEAALPMYRGKDSNCEFHGFTSYPLRIEKSLSDCTERECKPTKNPLRTDLAEVLNSYQFKSLGTPKAVETACCPEEPVSKYVMSGSKNSRCEFQTFLTNPIKLIDHCVQDFTYDINDPNGLRLNCGARNSYLTNKLYNCKTRGNDELDAWPHLSRELFERHTDVKCDKGVVRGRAVSCSKGYGKSKDQVLADSRCMNDDGILIALERDGQKFCNLIPPKHQFSSFHKERKHIRFLQPHSKCIDPTDWNHNASNALTNHQLNFVKICCENKNMNIPCDRDYHSNARFEAEIKSRRHSIARTQSNFEKL